MHGSDWLQSQEQHAGNNIREWGLPIGHWCHFLCPFLLVTLCPWCLPYSLHTQHMRGPDWHASSRQTNSMAWTWCCGHRVFSWGLSASGTRRCLASVRVECVSWEHSAHRWVAHTVQYMEAVWFSSSSHRIIHCQTQSVNYSQTDTWVTYNKGAKRQLSYFSHAFQSLFWHSRLVGGSILESLQQLKKSKVLF